MLTSRKSSPLSPPLSPSAPVSLRPGATLPDLAFVGLFVLMALCHLVAALLARGWITAAIADGVILGYLAGMLWSRPAWRPLIGRLLLFGLVAGVIELATDAAGE